MAVRTEERKVLWREIMTDVYCLGLRHVPVQVFYCHLHDPQLRETKSCKLTLSYSSLLYRNMKSVMTVY